MPVQRTWPATASLGRMAAKGRPRVKCTASGPRDRRLSSKPPSALHRREGVKYAGQGRRLNAQAGAHAPLGVLDTPVDDGGGSSAARAK